MNRWLVWTVGAGTFFLIAASVYAIEFTISNPQVGNEISVGVQLSSLAIGQWYLQGMLTAPSPTKYFGFTQNNSGVWYEYISSPSPEYIQANFFHFETSDGSWSGQLKIKNNTEDTDYKGPGGYIVKVKRYTGQSSSAAGESNALTIQLTSASPSPEPSLTPTASPQPTPTAAAMSKPTATPTVKPMVSPATAPKPTASAQVLAASIAAEIKATATPSATTQAETKKQGKWSWLMMIGGGGLAVAALFPFLRKWYHDPSWLKTLLKGGDRSSFGQE